VDSDELIFIFKELDVFPSTWTVGTGDHELLKLAHQKVIDASPADFSTFLELYREMEDMKESVEHPITNLKRYFDEHVADTGFQIAVPAVRLEDVELIFKKLGMQVRDRKVRSILRRVLARADMEGRGQLMLEAVRRLYLCTMKRLKIAAVLHEYDTAQRLGLGIDRLREIHEVFKVLDTDRSGSLEIMEVREACSVLNLVFESNKHFEVAFAMLDKSGNGALGFDEFMEFLRMVRHKEGPFKVAKLTKARTLDKLDRMDLFLLYQCMHQGEEPSGRPHSKERCPVTEQRVRTSMLFTTEDLLMKVSDGLEINSQVSLESAFGVTTLEELLEHAKISTAIKTTRESIEQEQCAVIAEASDEEVVTAEASDEEPSDE